MPAYNAAPYIGAAIASVLSQTMPHFELLIVNDGSTDNTTAVIQSFNDTRIRLIYQPNSGVAAALNKGLSLARGEYIARFDADDICQPNRLQQQMTYLDAHPDYVITGSDAEYISEQGEYLCYYSCHAHSNDAIKQHLHTSCPFTHSSVMYRRQAVLQCGGYPVLAMNMEDHLLWVKLSSAGKFYNFPAPLIQVRFNPASVTIDEKWRGRRFRVLKYGILQRGVITAAEGAELTGIVQKQNATASIRHGAYFALCGKKLLLNNHMPVKARSYIRKAIQSAPFRLDNYALFVISYFPEKYIQWLNKKMN